MTVLCIRIKNPNEAGVGCKGKRSPVKIPIKGVVAFKTAGFGTREFVGNVGCIDIVEIACRKPVIKNNARISERNGAEIKCHERKFLVDTLEVVDARL